MLTKLGLSQEAEAVYRAMLAEPAWGVADLSEHLCLPERTIRKALDLLADLDLLIESAEGGQWRPVHPDTGLVALLTHAEEELRRRQNDLESTRHAIAAITSQYQSRRGSELEGVRLDDLDLVRDRLSELARGATQECWSFSPGGAHRLDAMQASRPLNQHALERGVLLRCVYQDAFRNDPATVAYAEWLTGVGGQVRTVPAVPMQMVVVDRSIALLPISPTDPRHGAIEVRSSGVIAALCALFEQIWNTATPLGETPGRDDNGLSPQETEILRLLADGHTDDSISRRLGFSVRTVRRIIAELTERLESASRFQAGVKAVHSGWL